MRVNPTGAEMKGTPLRLLIQIPKTWACACVTGQSSGFPGVAESCSPRLPPSERGWPTGSEPRGCSNLQVPPATPASAPGLSCTQGLTYHAFHGSATLDLPKPSVGAFPGAPAAPCVSCQPTGWPAGSFSLSVALELHFVSTHRFLLSL